MAGDDGFEPPMSESKSDALTTWLIPNVDPELGLEPRTSRLWASPATIANTLEYIWCQTLVTLQASRRYELQLHASATGILWYAL